MDNRVCKGMAQSLVLYHYGELDPALAFELESHLGSCPNCRAELSEIEEALGALPRYNPTQGQVNMAVAGVMESISAPAVKPLARRLIPAYIAAAAVAVALVFTQYMPGNPVKGPQENQVAMAQTDWEMLENMDAIGDLDVIQELGSDGLDQLGPLNDL